MPGAARAKGFAEAMKANGLQPVAEVEAADFTFAAGRAAPNSSRLLSEDVLARGHSSRT